MKTKQLAEEQGALVEQSIGDQMAAHDYEGWLECNLIAMMADYAREARYPNGYEFAKAMQLIALEAFAASATVSESDTHGLPF